MKEIPLSRGQVAIVDDEDYEALAQHKWHAHRRSGGALYAARTTSRSVKPRRLIYMHREVTGARKGQAVDHRNHNGLDNRRENLRVCDTRQNAGNMRKLRKATSQYKGVWFDFSRGKWEAMIRGPGGSGPRRFLGRFATEAEAAAAYDKAALEVFGEFALLNKASNG